MRPKHTTPCTNCGSTENYCAKGLCRSCYMHADFEAKRGEYYGRTAKYRNEHLNEVRARDRAYAAKRIEQRHVTTRAHHWANRTKRLAQMAEWQAAHPEEVKAMHAAYRAAHPEKNREHAHIRRARERKQFIAPVREAEIWARDGGICQICRKPVPLAEMTLDHILPVAHGGTHEPRNVRTAHRSCNIRRQHRGAAQLRLLS